MFVQASARAQEGSAPAYSVTYEYAGGGVLQLLNLLKKTPLACSLWRT